MLDLRIDNARLYPMAGEATASAARSLGIRDGAITGLGTSEAAREVIDAGGRVVLPGLIDCHTHALYAGDRMDEHARKLAGATYAEIARTGGGIASTVRAVRSASTEALIAETLPRIGALAAEGVTTIEIKSGYGLDTATELRMLEAIGELAGRVPQRIVRTFLGAHAVPVGTTREEYVRLIVDEMLPAVAARKLAGCVDVFVESIAFSRDDAERIFRRARDLGLAVRAHAEQLSLMGASALASSLGALSCDHLEHLDDAGAQAMARAGTVAVILPAAFYFLRETRKPPVELLRQHAVPMAVASDLNPGSAPVASLLTALHMAVTLFGLTPAEALLGVTYNAARAIGRADLGALVEGRRADFTLWDIREPAFLAYQLGGLRPAATYIEGKRA